MLYMMVSLNRTVSCGTTAMAARSDVCVTSRTSWLSILTAPAPAQCLGMQCAVGHMALRGPCTCVRACNQAKQEAHDGANLLYEHVAPC